MAQPGTHWEGLCCKWSEFELWAGVGASAAGSRSMQNGNLGDFYTISLVFVMFDCQPLRNETFGLTFPKLWHEIVCSRA